MDGLVETSGRIIICTANDPNKISEPFKRPGRLDEHIEFTKCTRHMVIQLLELFYSTTLNEEQMAKINNIENDIQFKYSPAEINKFCFNNLTSVDDVISELFR
jgi:SpoVK/Ycf46/Vps4 family AAA+-type ATPase